MGSNQRQQLMEQYEDAALALLMDEYAEEEGARLLQEFEELGQNGASPEIPAELDAKCRQLINSAFKKQNSKPLAKRVGKFAAKAAAVFLVVLGLSTVTVLSVDAFRVPVLHFIADQSGEFSKVVFSEDVDVKTDRVSATIARFESCLPEGYKVQQKNVGKTMCRIRCVNSNDSSISLNISKQETGLAVDTEDADFVKVSFGDYLGAFKEKNGYHLIWIDDEMVYNLYASALSLEEFWELAYATAG